MLKDLAMAVVVLAVVAELALRWAVGLGDPPLAQLDPATEYELVPSATYQRWGNTVAINADSMRGADHPALPANEDQHLLLIGDSVVYGGHFLGQSQIISEQMNNLFAADRRFAACSVRVLPMAVSSWGPVNQAAFLQKKGTFGATTAGIVVSAHDLYDVPLSNSDILPYRTKPSRTAIGDLAQAVLERVMRTWGTTEDTQPFEVKAALSLAALDDMVDVLRDQNLDPVLIYHPTVSERGGDISAEQDRFLAWSQTRGVAFFDLGFLEFGQNDYRDDIHPTAIGAERIAQALTPFMANRLARCPGD